MAHTGGDISPGFIGDSTANVQDFFDIDAEWGPASGDVRHNFLANTTYHIAPERFASSVARHLLGGWDVAAIVRARSGAPIEITQTSSRPTRPDLVGTLSEAVNDECCSPGNLQYLNAAAFRLVPINSLSGAGIRPGTIGHNALRGPGYAVLDMSIGKSVSLPGTRADTQCASRYPERAQSHELRRRSHEPQCRELRAGIQYRWHAEESAVPGAPDFLNEGIMGQHSHQTYSKRRGGLARWCGFVSVCAVYATVLVAPSEAQPFRELPDPATFQWRDLRNELRNKMTGVYTVTSGGDFLWRNPINKRISPELRDVMRNADTTIGNLESQIIDPRNCVSPCTLVWQLVAEGGGSGVRRPRGRLPRAWRVQRRFVRPPVFPAVSGGGRDQNERRGPQPHHCAPARVPGTAPGTGGDAHRLSRNLLRASGGQRRRDARHREARRESARVSRCGRR